LRLLRAVPKVEKRDDESFETAGLLSPKRGTSL